MLLEWHFATVIVESGIVYLPFLQLCAMQVILGYECFTALDTQQNLQLLFSPLSMHILGFSVSTLRLRACQKTHHENSSAGMEIQCCTIDSNQLYFSPPV